MAVYAALAHVGASWIKSVREKYQLSKSDAAKMCCVTEATFRRWESGESLMNPCIFHYWLSVLERRLLPRNGLAGKRWNGWYFEDGKLYTPHKNGLTAAEIESQHEQILQMRALYRNASEVRKHAKSGLTEAGAQWHGWQFIGGFLVSPDGRKIGPRELYVMLVGYDAMNAAKQHGYHVKNHQNLIRHNVD